MRADSPVSEGESRVDLRLERLDPIGVEVLGLDLREPVDDATWLALRETVMREGVVVFREQPMSAQAQIALGRRFGELENTALDRGEMDESKTLLANVGPDGEFYAEDDPNLQLVAINEGWHTDSSFRDVPASFSLFAGVTVPEEGGDTFFASLERGWEALPAQTQAGLYGLHATHDYDRAYATRGVDLSDVFGGAAPSSRHPVVRRHPETGRPGLFVSEHVFEVDGLPDEDAASLVEELLRVCVDPARVYRHHWAAGDLLVWDNRSMLHRAQGFDPRHPRVMRHVRVAGSEAVLPAHA
jgi:alpha-ketoglutarate-dependent taurine dioxygenase